MCYRHDSVGSSPFTVISVSLQLERLAAETPAACNAAADRLMAELSAQRAGQLHLRTSIERMEAMAANNTAAVIQALREALTLG